MDLVSLTATQAHAKRQVHAILWAKAYHKADALTFSMPRTRNCVIPRLRAWALAHSRSYGAAATSAVL
jgi:hypothetical protein